MRQVSAARAKQFIRWPGPADGEITTGIIFAPFMKVPDLLPNAPRDATPIFDHWPPPLSTTKHMLEYRTSRTQVHSRPLSTHCGHWPCTAFCPRQGWRYVSHAEVEASAR